MNKGSYVFSQMVKALDEFVFLRIVKKYDGDKYVKHFSCWNQLLTLMFGQLTGKESLRRFIVASTPFKNKFYGLGLGKNVTRSNLSKANNSRDYRIFEEFANHMVRVAQKKRIKDIFKLHGKVYAFDSTTIDLCLSVYDWAHFRRAKGGIKVHTLFDLEAQVPTIFHITKAKVNDVNGMDVIPYEPNAFYVFDRGYNDFRRLFHINELGSFFVVRAKKTLKYQHVRWKRRMKKNVLSDSIIRLTIYKSSHDYPAVLRRIEYFDEEQNRIFVYLTNALSLDALDVANLYKNRWQIELFFNSRTILSTVASSTVPRICPTQRASSISTVTWPVKALVEATPISGPTWMYVPESVFLGIEAPTTLQMPYTKAPLLRANCMAATVPSGHTSFVTPYTSQRRSRMPQKEAG